MPVDGSSELDEFDPQLIDYYLETFPPGDDDQLNIWRLEGCASEGNSDQLDTVLSLLSQLPKDSRPMHSDALRDFSAKNREGHATA